MGDPEPDIAAIFAPLKPAQATDVVLSEAREVLSQIQRPIDAELWGSDMLGALTRNKGGEDGAEALAELVGSLVPAAEKEATTESLGLLRVLSSIGDEKLRESAKAAAERVADGGVKDLEWAEGLGSPKIGPCWHYSDIGGRQESVTVSFGYGDDEHALSVLIDHGKGGKIKDAWVDNAEGLLDKTWLAAENDPLIVFENLEPGEATERLADALAAGEAPTKSDEADDLTAHRALLRARIRHLTAN